MFTGVGPRSPSIEVRNTDRECAYHHSTSLVIAEESSSCHTRLDIKDCAAMNATGPVLNRWYSAVAPRTETVAGPVEEGREKGDSSKQPRPRMPTGMHPTGVHLVLASTSIAEVQL